MTLWFWKCRVAKVTQHILGPVTKYKLLYVSNKGKAGARVRNKWSNNISGFFTLKTNPFGLF